MNTLSENVDSPSAEPGRRLGNRNAASWASDLLPLIDCGWLLVSAALCPGLQAGLSAALVAPFVFYDPRFGALARFGRTRVWARSFVLRFVALAVWVGLLTRWSQPPGMAPAGALALWLGLSLLSTGGTRVLLDAGLQRLQRRGRLTETVAVVGAGPLADQLVQLLRQQGPAVAELLGVFDDKRTGLPPGSTPPAGDLDALLALGRQRRIDWILITLPPTAEQRLLAVVQRLRTLPVPIGLCPQNLGQAGTGTDFAVAYVGDGLPLSLLADRPLKRWDGLIKAGVDFGVGGLLTVLSLPLFALIALAIRLDSPGPVIFRQRRHAMNGQEFDIFKFRTMRWDPAAATDNLQQTVRQDARVTRLGHFLRSSSLDELPQLFNVLRGEMSLVGPRPHAVNMRTQDLLGPDVTETYAHRYRVKPGITGWAQVNGARGATDTTTQLRRRVELDLYYIDNWSLWFDLKILLLTSRAVIRKTNAY